MSITAFPVLARMLKENGLIYTYPGSICMGAAALDDFVAWCLLTLSIAIASSRKKAVGAYVFLCVVFFALGLFILVRPVLAKIVKFLEAKNSRYWDGQLFSLIVCLLFMCAWTTGKQRFGHLCI